MKITKEYLKQVITESIQEELEESEEVNEVSDTLMAAGAIGGIIAAIPIVGYVALKGLATGVKKYQDIKAAIETYKREESISQRQAKNAERLAQLTEKYANNPELIQLLEKRQLKLFVQKLSELNQQDGGNGIGPNLGRDVYDAAKEKHGMTSAPEKTKIRQGKSR